MHLLHVRSDCIAVALLLCIGVCRRIRRVSDRDTIAGDRFRGRILLNAQPLLHLTYAASAGPTASPTADV